MKKQGRGSKHIIVSAGGTGGHVIPAITLCKALVDSGIDCKLIHDERVQHIVEKHADFSVKQLFFANNLSKKVKFLQQYIKALMVLLNVLICMLIFASKRPNLVIGFGGYVTAPALIGARILSIPIMIIEQNSVLGRVNRKFVDSSAFIITAFDKTIGLEVQKYKNKIHQHAMFAPKELNNVKVHSGKDTRKLDDKINILITGGSQGSHEFSDVVPNALRSLPVDILKRCRILFQTRDYCVDRTKESLASMRCASFKVESFFYDMPKKMLEADLIIARAGASTIAEICAAKLCSVLIPYKYAKDDHQVHNAIALQKAGGAYVVMQDSDMEKKLSKVIHNLLQDSKLRDKTAASAGLLYNSNNINQIVQLCANFR